MRLGACGACVYGLLSLKQGTKVDALGGRIYNFWYAISINPIRFDSTISFAGDKALVCIMHRYHGGWGSSSTPDMLDILCFSGRNPLIKLEDIDIDIIVGNSEDPISLLFRSRPLSINLPLPSNLFQSQHQQHPPRASFLPSSYPASHSTGARPGMKK
jgi:hypothetical protein